MEFFVNQQQQKNRLLQTVILVGIVLLGGWGFWAQMKPHAADSVDAGSVPASAPASDAGSVPVPASDAGPKTGRLEVTTDPEEITIVSVL